MLHSSHDWAQKNGIPIYFLAVYRSIILHGYAYIIEWLIVVGNKIDTNVLFYKTNRWICGESCVRRKWWPQNDLPSCVLRDNDIKRNCMGRGSYYNYCVANHNELYKKDNTGAFHQYEIVDETITHPTWNQLFVAFCGTSSPRTAISPILNLARLDGVTLYSAQGQQLSWSISIE